MYKNKEMEKVIKRNLGEGDKDYKGEKGELYKVAIDNYWHNELDGFTHILSERTHIELSGIFYEELERFVEHLIDNAEDNMRKRCLEALPKVIDIDDQTNYRESAYEDGVDDGFNKAIDQATQNINNLDKDNE